MQKVRNQWLVIILCVFLALSSSGCVALVAGAVGAGGVLFFKGILEKNYDYSVAKVYKASVAACKSLDIPIHEKKIDKHNAVIKGITSDGKDVTIEVEALTERASKLKIRIGVFGDEEMSHIILTAVENKL